MEKLIERLEAASEGSRELDNEIYAVANGYERVSGGSVDGGIIDTDFWITGAGPQVIGGGVLVGKSPPFTCSIDAARGLLSVGMSFSLSGPASDYMTPHGGSAIVCRQENYVSEHSPQFRVSATGATSALALCAAALKARESV